MPTVSYKKNKKFQVKRLPKVNSKNSTHKKTESITGEEVDWYLTHVF